MSALREIRKRRGLTQADVGAMINTTDVSISRYENEDDRLTLPLMRKLAAKLDCTIAEIAGERQLSEGAGALAITHGEFVFEKSQYVAVPAYDQRVSAGPGSVAQDESPLYHLFYRQEWLRSLTHTAAESLAVLEVWGDSMEPTLHNGDHVLVDRSVKKIGREGIYVIRYNAEDDLRVKRCTRMARTKLINIRSDNASYPAEEGVKDTDIEVIGRVVWLGRNIGG
jgi:phage repressor protein C with HTH and peptisase S24 domain